MKKRMLEPICLTVICISMLATMLVIHPVSSQPQRGPRIDTLRYKVTRSPAAQLIELTAGPPVGSDAVDGWIRPSDVEEMDRQGRAISSRGGFHYCRIMMNVRAPCLNDVNYRHALMHLLPKDRIIGNLFKYVVVKTNTPAPPAQGPWYNGDVDPHPYSPAEAEAVLAAAILPNGDPKYEKVDGVWRYASGAGFENVRFYTPLEVVAPTSFTCARMLVEEAQNIGLMNIVQAPADFATYVNTYTYTQKNFELSWVCHGLGRFATHLWSQYSPANYRPPGTYAPNPHGNIDPALEAVLNTLYTDFDLQNRIDAAQEAQAMIMGGTTTDPLPLGIDTTNHPRNQSLLVIPMYSRNMYDVQYPELRGAVNGYGTGIRNGWTLMNIHWNNPDNFRPGTTEKTVVWVEGEYPEKLNQLTATTVYAADFIDNTQDGLIAVNPYTLRDIDWLAQPTWHYEKVPGGMDVTFDIKLTDPQGAPIVWADGKPIKVEDVKFSWDFLRNWQIGIYWSVFRYYDPANTVILDTNTIRARMTLASPWNVYDLAAAAYILPPQVWTQDPRDGVWANTLDIETFDPSALAYPTAYNIDPGPTSLPTQMFSLGPFTLQHSRDYIVVNGYGDMAANRNYWRTTDEIQDLIEGMFWRAGDSVNDDKIDGSDLGAVGEAFDTIPGDLKWNVDADVTGPAGTPPDEHVDVDDLATTGKYFGEPETVPYSVGTP